MLLGYNSTKKRLFLIAIVDYNMGNLASVQNAFEKVGAKAIIEKDPDALKHYDKLLLPGVGAFGDAMKHLKQTGLDESIVNFANTGKPLLGICLGMQLLFESSEEFGTHKGLGLVQGEVVAFDKSRFGNASLKIPQMGWNRLMQRGNSSIFKGLESSFYLYFVHSFHAVTTKPYTIGTTQYGYPFVSAVQKENIFGLQPHPEKSHTNGLKIIENFANL